MIVITNGKEREIDSELYLEEECKKVSSEEEMEQFNKLVRTVRLFNGNLTVIEDEN